MQNQAVIRNPRICPRAIPVAVIAVACWQLLAAVPAFALPAEGVTPVNNRQYISTVRELVQHAKKGIALMLYQTRYYDEYPDTQTNHLLKDLIEAKQRGVDVKIVVDTGDWNPSNKNDYNLNYMDRLTTAGIQVWEDSTTEVSHQKVICIDDSITVVSSHNWTYYSIANNNEVAAVIFSKPVNEWFRGYFRERCLGGKPYANATTSTSLESKAGGASLNGNDLPSLRKYPAADVTPIANRLFYPAVHEAILNARKSVDVVQRSINMYDRPRLADGEKALPGRPASETNVLVEDLVSAHKRGVKVRVILDRTEGFDDSTNDDTARFLKQRGVEVLRDDLAVQTHAKFLLIDGDKVVLGSTNWTQPALEDGNEASVLITSVEVNKVYQDYVNTLLQSSAPYQAVSKSIWDAPSTVGATTKR
jgi:phosphatidylserine/phosphatidylglycerophosphate/cardiolipin synthase-like enzyme